MREYTGTADEPHWIPMPDGKSGESAVSCTVIILGSFQEFFYVIGRKLYSYIFKLNVSD